MSSITHISEPLRVGIIGYDTSHVTAFTRLLHDTTDPFHVPGARVVAGYPSASSDLAASISRLGGFTTQMQDLGVQTVLSIEALLDAVDAVLLESVDGRRHLAEATPVIKARKPLFIDKPLAHTYADAAAIAELAAEYGCPLFTSSSLRYDANVRALQRNSAVGAVHSCDAFSPAALEPKNPGLFWYGVHGVELLYTFMGQGCQSVSYHGTGMYDVIVGNWPDGRIGTMRGLRGAAQDFGVTVFGEKGVGQTCYSREVPLYSQLLKQIVPFFQSGQSPIPIEESLEIIAFMEAALISQLENREVSLDEVRQSIPQMV